MFLFEPREKGLPENQDQRKESNSQLTETTEQSAFIASQPNQTD